MPDMSQGVIRPYSVALVELNRVFDGLFIVFSLWMTHRLLNLQWHSDSLALGLLAVALFTIVAGYNSLYRSWRSMPLRIEIKKILICWTLTALMLGLLVVFVSPYLTISRKAIFTWLILTPVTLATIRSIIRGGLRYIRIRGHNYRTAAIVGANDLGRRIDTIITHSAWMGLRPAGFYDDRQNNERLPEDFPRELIKGSIEDLVEKGARGEIDIIYITLPMRAEERIKMIISEFSDTTVRIYYVPDFFAFDLLRSEWETVGGVPIISVVDSPIHGVNSMAKRLEDLVLASLILAATGLPMLLIALAIKLTSRGPVIYTQKRYGLDGREFEIYKFRTMRTGQDDRFVQATRDDPRITPIGAFLRSTSLDELPQFINVLQGRMSVVGPRPHPVELNEQHRRIIHRYMLRHIVKPGITGWAQINGYRGETDTIEKMENRVKYDLEYIREWSLWFDLKIVLLTLLKGFTGKNAY
ncbi:undecaprenyl-phosphate glucose phosphotransferase [Thiohalobacter sp. IOR34]|uniref:undecaprenyl-phosphate glucose phosphotransferase n=1 Tax=Thiohalobacter sp. IOR34 TaxID=3057176 RepID=UPI0025B16436|nr:undecaprenyl-phosphate glucose phosphotransferase [Thiohalobacter sp. IOR34]WJW76289.1 undecaprenyl-phosphate glucose phosphotransferase [Thiohalobacter sp. IOR34]